MAHSSKTAFSQAMTDYGLGELAEKFKEMGWETFADFAFATSDPSGKDASAFQKEVVETVLTPEQKAMIPKLRRLYAQSYIFATKAMTDEADPKPVTEIIPMHDADRNSRAKALRDRITGWKLTGQNLPSQALVDKFSTMLTKGHVKYVAWDKCTSKEQELLEEPDVKGLRITPDGLLLQDVAKDFKTEISGEFLWDFALRRRACAGDVSGLLCYEAQNEWQEILKTTFLKQAPPGHRRVSWAQLRNADVELWSQVAMTCEEGTKATKPGEQTAFEKAWRIKMHDQDVRACLAFLPGPSGSTSTELVVHKPVSLVPGPGPSSGESSEVQKLKRRLEQQESQINNLKFGKSSRGNRKGKGKDKGKGKGKSEGRAPPDLGRRPARTPNGENICFTFNRASGCPLAKAGGGCHRGRHVCIVCYGDHSITLPCPNLG